MKFFCTFFLLAFLSPPLQSQVETFIGAGFRLPYMPKQSFIDDFQDQYAIVDFAIRPALKMEAGLRFRLFHRFYVEFSAAYSVHPIDYLKNRQVGEGTPSNTLKVESFDYAGYMGLISVAQHINYSWGSDRKWESFVGLRTTSFYLNRQKGLFTREEYIVERDGMGNFEYVKVDDYETGVGIIQRGITFRGIAEAGVRSWCLQKGQAGLEINGGFSLSNIYREEFKLRAHFLGMSYVRKWGKSRKNTRRRKHL